MGVRIQVNNIQPQIATKSSINVAGYRRFFGSKEERCTDADRIGPFVGSGRMRRQKALRVDMNRLILKQKS